MNSLGLPKSFVWATIALIVCFGVPLLHLVWFAATSELYSYILLVPFVSVYLAWGKRRNMSGVSAPDRRFTAFAWSMGSVLLVGYWLAIGNRWPMAEQDQLAWTIAAFLCFLLGISARFAGSQNLRVMRFPLFFLVFMVPFPTGMNNWLETLLQRGSALTAYALFQFAGTSVFYSDLSFQFPGFGIEVAPQCSGIHSSLVLFLTSLVAGHLFLRARWRQGILALAVLPLGLLRNGFRIFVISQLCIHFGPQMLSSAIHRNGGPVFFALSMVPFLGLLILLRRSERGLRPIDLRSNSSLESGKRG